LRPGEGFIPPLQGGAFQLERIPRVSPWAIFISSLWEEALFLTGSQAILIPSLWEEARILIYFLPPGGGAVPDKFK
jgi:membrane protein YqaA with SNARE-associated domain